MTGRLATLSNLYSDLADRYGKTDPIVAQLLGQIEHEMQRALVLPFGERRRTQQPRRPWGPRPYRLAAAGRVS